MSAISTSAARSGCTLRSDARGGIICSRLCASADDRQILVDPVVAERAKDNFVLVSLGERAIKGYDRALEVFAVIQDEATAEIFRYQTVEMQPDLA